MTFNASDPQHAKVNQLRVRRDKPHIWFEEGYWRVSPKPITRRMKGNKLLLAKWWGMAHSAVHMANYKIINAKHCMDEAP